MLLTQKVFVLAWHFAGADSLDVPRLVYCKALMRTTKERNPLAYPVSLYLQLTHMTPYRLFRFRHYEFRNRAFRASGRLLLYVDACYVSLTGIRNVGVYRGPHTGRSITARC